MERGERVNCSVFAKPGKQACWLIKVNINKFQERSILQNPQQVLLRTVMVIKAREV